MLFSVIMGKTELAVAIVRVTNGMSRFQYGNVSRFARLDDK